MSDLEDYMRAYYGLDHAARRAAGLGPMSGASSPYQNQGFINQYLRAAGLGGQKPDHDATGRPYNSDASKQTAKQNSKSDYSGAVDCEQCVKCGCFNCEGDCEDYD